MNCPDPHPIFPPSQFEDASIRLVKVKERGKEAIERGWPTSANYGVHSKLIQEWIRNGGNYGVTSPMGVCVFVDADTREIQDALENKLPRTFRWSTGKPGHFQYGYFVQDGPVGCISLQNGAYIKGKGGYALGPGSVHPNGTVYGSREIRDVAIAIVNKADLLDALGRFITGKESSYNKHTGKIPKGSGQILKVLAAYGADINNFKQVGSWYRGSHPVHGSGTGSNFAVNPETDVWHCFRHNTGGGLISLITVLERLVDCQNIKGGD